MAKELTDYLMRGQWRTSKKSDWNIETSKSEKRKKYVGLENLGCTCYMNSLM